MKMKTIMLDEEALEAFVQILKMELEIYMIDEMKYRERGWDDIADMYLKKIIIAKRVLEACKNCSETDSAV